MQPEKFQVFVMQILKLEVGIMAFRTFHYCLCRFVQDIDSPPLKAENGFKKSACDWVNSIVYFNDFDAIKKATNKKDAGVYDILL